mmetsp:Transcript_27248/g.31155  ORF Transcript_27248/g.31155 Transcript_27248/m.31155 type:complete len:307 (-) Transcript_27248:125-1045(-)
MMMTRKHRGSLKVPLHHLLFILSAAAALIFLPLEVFSFTPSLSSSLSFVKHSNDVNFSFSSKSKLTGISKGTGTSKLKLHLSNNNTNNNNNNNNNTNNNDEDSILTRFTSPQIDDPGLPLADALLSQIVAPTLQLYWISFNRLPIPSWATSLPGTSASMGMLYNVPTQGSLVAPTLLHGAGLTLCWILGSLAARGYEVRAYDLNYDADQGQGKGQGQGQGQGYIPIIFKIIQAGSFATGLLILSTQIDLLLEFGRYVQPGESDEIDFRLLNGVVELINDVVFEAGVLSLWRVYRASLTSSSSSSPN